MNENILVSEIHTLDQSWQFMSPGPGWRSHPFRAVACLGQRLLSLICLIATLTVLAAIPGTNLYAMGYLLSAQARIARTGRFRDALILLPAARRIVVVTIATTACLLIIAWLARLVREAWLISSGSLVYWLLTGGLILASTLSALHISRAILRGGTLWEFLRPDRSWRKRLTFCRSDARSQDSPGLNGLLPSLQIWHHMRPGLLNYLAIYAVLALPTWLYTAMQDQSRVAERILFLSGAILLILVLAFLPFLQVHLAVRENLVAMTECGSVIKRFRNAPGAHLLAVLVLLGLSALVPLYQALLKLQLPPNSILWDVMLVTIVLTLPGRILAAWAWHRGSQARQVWRSWRWTCGTAIIAATGAYVGFLMLAASSGQLGSHVIWQHHALVLPLPF